MIKKDRADAIIFLKKFVRMARYCLTDKCLNIDNSRSFVAVNYAILCETQEFLLVKYYHLELYFSAVR